MAHAPAKTSPASSQRRFIFPRWANLLLPFIVLMVGGGAVYMPTFLAFAFSPQTTDVGYMPEQPVPYSHALHVGQLGIDCLYCHTTVDKAAFAAIPPTQTCMNCHTNIKANSNLLAPVRESWASGKSVEWVKIHDLPDYAYFNHSAHVNVGVSCVSCHGRVDQMEVVWQDQPLSMGWCLDCHREPEKHIRPKDQVTNLGWTPSDLSTTNPDIYADMIADRPELANKGVTQLDVGAFLKARYGVKDPMYMTSCSTCHR